MRCFAVIDTNVIVSALWKKDSVPAQILQYVDSGYLCPLLSNAIIAEYREVLSRPKFEGKFTKQDATEAMRIIQEQGIHLEPENFEAVDFGVSDAKDIVFYAVVMEKRKEDDAYLVTGNRPDFPKEPFVVSPREMLELLKLMAQEI